jgi:anti-sigma factor RsiW
MSCRRFRKSLVEYADSRLEGGKEEALLSHLQTCEGCTGDLAKLQLSRAALSSLGNFEMPAAATERVAATIRNTAQAAPERSRFSRAIDSMSTPRNLGTAGAAVAAVLAIAIVVLAYTGGGRESALNRKPAETTAPASATDVNGASNKQAYSGVPSLAATIMPAVKVSKNNYDDGSLRQTFDDMEIRKKIATDYGMIQAISLCDLYRRKVADMMVDAGEDGAMLEAMISYITSSEAVLLPYYAEHALYSGQPVFIIGLAGPRRTGQSTRLTRTEIWVMSPEKFASSSPETSIVYFMEKK